MARVVHFEIFTDDTAGTIEFYKQVFGWDVSAWEGPFEYHLVGTGPSGEPGIDGAIAPLGAAGEQRVVLTVDVDDLDAAIGRAVTSGAQLIGDKNEIPGVGVYVYLRDPAGAVFGMMQSAPGSEGRDVWSEFGESLRQLGETVSGAFSEATSSQQAQRAREETERAMRGIRDASAGAADKARPHVITALDRVSQELGNLAARLRRDEVAEERVAEGTMGVSDSPVEPVEEEEGYTPPPPNPEC